MRAAITLLLLAFSLSCASRVALPPPSQKPSSELRFVIRESGRLPLRELSGVEVSVIGASGELTTLGRSFAGTFRVAKERLKELRPQAILFCLEGYHCGAVRPQPSFDLHAYDEYPIDLAPLVLY